MDRVCSLKGKYQGSIPTRKGTSRKLLGSSNERIHDSLEGMESCQTLGVRPGTHSVLLTAMHWDWLRFRRRCIAVGSEGGWHDSISDGDDWPPGQTVDIVF